MKKLLMAPMMILWVWTACLAALPQRPDISAIEEKLLEWVNKERTARNLNPLRFSPGLRAVAIEHSKDMASQQKLTHLSSSGKSYLDRLVEAGLFFIEIGENVAVRPFPMAPPTAPIALPVEPSAPICLRGVTASG